MKKTFCLKQEVKEVPVYMCAYVRMCTNVCECVIAFVCVLCECVIAFVWCCNSPCGWGLLLGVWVCMRMVVTACVCIVSGFKCLYVYV